MRAEEAVIGCFVSLLRFAISRQGAAKAEGSRKSVSKTSTTRPTPSFRHFTVFDLISYQSCRLISVEWIPCATALYPVQGYSHSFYPRLPSPTTALIPSCSRCPVCSLHVYRVFTVVPGHLMSRTAGRDNSPATTAPPPTTSTQRARSLILRPHHPPNNTRPLRILRRGLYLQYNPSPTTSSARHVSRTSKSSQTSSPNTYRQKTIRSTSNMKMNTPSIARISSNDILKSAQDAPPRCRSISIGLHMLQRPTF